MDPEQARDVTGSAPLTAIAVKPLPPTQTVIQFDEVSKWYGNVIGVNKLTLRIAGGVTGLLGPNGAGKSTLLQLATGQLAPSQGSVRVLGHHVWNNPALNTFIGLCPEQDAFWEWMTGRDFIFTCARLTGMSWNEAFDHTERVLDMVSMTANANRPVRGYSKGMRQRTKLAQALVHDPEVLFLDEPFTGTDPVARRELMDIISQLAGQGKTIVVSSHVLHEVQSLTQNIVLMNRGRLVAEGNIRDIRDLIDKHPHRIVVVSPHYRRLATALASWDDVEGLKIIPTDRSVVAETRVPDQFYSRLPALSLEDGTAIEEVYSEDDNLEAVFKYLVSK
jgi:ABC-2 type transport system ATP-binding protein